MLTRTGWSVLAAAVALYAASVALGYPELAVLALGCALMAVSGLLWTLPRPALEVGREIAPEKVTRGEPAVGEVTVVNAGRQARSGLHAIDLCGGRPVEVAIPRLARNARRTMSYRLPSEHCGKVLVGPLRLVRTDPLGMIRRVHSYGDTRTLLVRPRVHPLTMLPSGRVRNLEGPTSDKAQSGTVTFHALREYVPGDDLRHIHWRSTARAGTIMIRQLVDASRPQATIVLDVRPDAYSGADQTARFEFAVDVAASIAVAAVRQAFPVRIATSAGLQIAARGGRHDVSVLLDRLALVQPDPLGGLAGVLDALRRSHGEGLLAVVSGFARGDEVGRVVSLGRRFDRVLYVLVADADDVPGQGLSLERAGLSSIVATTPEALVAAWRRETMR